MPRPPGLRIEGARQNNLKNVSLEIPHDRLTVVTGVSGSGKSSLAFDTLFAEGQWRYIESLSTYARMFLDRVDRPDVDRIENIRPAVALEQKNPVRTARSTVGTATEVYDYLRLLYAKIGRVHCPACGARRRLATPPDSIADALLARARRRARARDVPPARSRPACRPPSCGPGSPDAASRGALVDGVQCDLASPPPDGVERARSRWCSTASCSIPAHRSAPDGIAWRPRCAKAAARSRSRWSTVGGASSPRPFAAARAAPRSSGRSRCSSPSTIRSAPAPSARASATSSSTTRRSWCPTARSASAAARSSRGRIPRASGTSASC